MLGQFLAGLSGKRVASRCEAKDLHTPRLDEVKPRRTDPSHRGELMVSFLAKKNSQ
ncbi:hypothetical protein ACFL23_04145 [Patescibacteria group bacterium]